VPVDQPQQQQEQRHTQWLTSLVQQHFPPISFGFAYGSGVFVQPDLYHKDTPAGSGPMLDFIFVVEDPLDWHTQVAVSSCNHQWVQEAAAAMCTSLHANA